MRIGRVKARHLLLSALLSGLLLNTGCQQIQALIQMVMSSAGGGGGIFNPGGGGGGGGILPPGLGGGSSGPLAPNSLLPAPAQSQATVQQVAQTYGVQIYGSGAAGTPLDTVVDGLRHYPLDKIQGLGSINMPLLQGSQGLLGDWSVSGGPAHINFYVQQGRRNPLWNNTVVHELAHHATLYHDDFGNRLRPAVGNGPNAYPSDYSQTDPDELLAETMSFALLGDRSYERPFASWRLTQAAKDLIQREIVDRRPKI